MTLTTSRPTRARSALPTLPRIAGVVGAVLVAAGVYGLAVWTSPGQLVDQTILDLCRRLTPVTGIPRVLVPQVVSNPLLWLVVGIVVVGLVAPTRRWGSLAALVAFPPVTVVVVQFLRDHVLARPQLHDWITETTNSAPSGHAAAVTACAVVVMLATPRRFRPWVAALLGTWAAVIEFGLIAAGWHRPSDVIISTVLVVGVGCLLPDPHTGSRASHVEWLLAGVTVALAAPVLVAVYYPAGIAVATTVLVAGVVAVAITATGR